MYFFKKQAAISFVCIAGALFISLFDYHILARFTGVLYAMAAASMILVRTPLGTVSNGARRWLKIGPIQFQPAEIAKIAVIVCLSYIDVYKRQEFRRSIDEDMAGIRQVKRAAGKGCSCNRWHLQVR